MDTAHTCPVCTEELELVDDANMIFHCERCDADYYGTQTAEGDYIVVGEC